MSILSSLERRRQIMSQKSYLTELTSLLKKKVSSDMLKTTDQDFLEIHKSIKDKFLSSSVTVYEIPFTAKRGNVFKSYIQKLYEANPSPIHIWTPHTNECKKLLVSSLNEVDWDFDFSIYEGGIASFTTIDFQDSLLLDWTEECGEQRLTLEAQGSNWASVKFE